MITADQIREHIGRRPFTPFRITLVGGETIDVSRTNQAVAMREKVAVATHEDRLRWIRLDCVDHIE